MNDFLNRLAQQRQNTSREDEWKQWSAAHKYDGHHVWDARGSPAVSASVKAFLNMVPERFYRSGIAIAAPRYLHDGAQYAPGVVRTDIRFMHDLASVGEEARTIWQREGASVRYVPVDWSHHDDGYTVSDTFLVLEDGRVVDLRLGLYSPSRIDNLYEGMAQFIVANNL